jgi:sarcosine oxidase, subunit alpha
VRAGPADTGATAEGDGPRFSFDGKAMVGRPGDTIASALLRNGVRIVGRSFKYHRPRGIWGYWSEEPNALVDISHEGRATPNARATMEPLCEGMALISVNACPSASKDRLSLLDRFASFIQDGSLLYATLQAHGAGRDIEAKRVGNFRDREGTFPQ